MKIVSLRFNNQTKKFTYMKGGIDKQLTIAEAFSMIRPESHTFESKREGLKYTIQSLTNGQLTHYLKIIEKYTNYNLVGQEYMDFQKHLPTIDSEKYSDCYESHYLAIILEKINRKMQERNK